MKIKKNVIPTPASTIKKEKPWERTLQEGLFENNLTKFNNIPPNFENQSISGTNFDAINNAESSSARSSLGESKKRIPIIPGDLSDISIDETDDETDDNDEDYDDDDDDDANLTNELTPELVDFKATAKYLGVEKVLDEKNKILHFWLKNSDIPAELNFDFDKRKLIINGNDEYPLTRNLWILITTDRATQQFINKLNKQEMDTYFQIIRKYYKLENFTSKQTRNKKYQEIILPRLSEFLTPVGTEGRGMSNKKYLNSLGLKQLIPKNKPVFIYWNNIEELIARLRKLIASKYAGNTSVEEENEILSIIEELREEKIIA